MQRACIFPLALCLIMMLALPAPALAGKGPTTITFPSEDGLAITADVYLAGKGNNKPFIVLFHQAGWSRGEYRDIAPALNALGYSCMAVDQRSGGEVKGVTNQTHARAHYARGTLIAWGSSYSAALVLRVAGEHPELVDVAMAFAPGEYFAKLGKSGTCTMAAGFQCGLASQRIARRCDESRPVHTAGISARA